MVRGGFRLEMCGAVFRKATGHLDSVKPADAIVRIHMPPGVNSLTSFWKSYFPFLQTGARKLEDLKNTI
jgi:hypothetical protein